MYINENNDVAIRILLEENGIYIFNNQAGTGKTRLFKELRTLQSQGELISTYTYSDKLEGNHIEKVLIPNKFELIMLDRYDMYKGEGEELINECAKNSVVLIACNGDFTASMDDRWCDINMGANYIEVVD